MWLWLTIWGGHVVLGLLMHRSSQLATLHALATLGGAGLIALTSRSPVPVTMAMGYIVGAEVLWRMNKAAIPWEAGKFAVIGILLLYGLRFRSRLRAGWPLFLFCLLVPSAISTLFEIDFNEARQMVSYNLSGPIVLAVALWFCRGLQLQRGDLANIYLVTVTPLMALLAITVTGAYSEAAVFTSESSFSASGGYGPNQVSAMLSLGIMLLFALNGLLDWNKLGKWCLAGVMLLFAMQSAMTFSRTGLYLAGGGLLAASFFLLGSRRARGRLIIGGVALTLLLSLIIFPRLDAYTGGALSERFNDVSTTSRWEIFHEEIGIFLEDPLFGIGAGMAKYKRQEFYGVASHSEFSRLLAEHGMLGVLFLTGLSLKSLHRFRWERGLYARAIFAASTVWFTGLLLASGMRMAAPAFVLGLAFARYEFAQCLPLRGGNV